MINIRQAAEKDIDELVLMGQALFNESPTYNLKAFVREKLVSFLENVIINPNCFAKVAENGKGEMIGYFIGGLTDDICSYEITAFDFSFFVLPNARKGGAAVKLIKAFEEWARDHRATFIRVGVSTGVHVEKTSKFYQLLGYKPDGVCLEKRVR